jgi:hypothetical protein
VLVNDETGGVPRLIVVTMPSDSSHQSEDSDSITHFSGSQMHSTHGDGGHDLKRKYAEIMKANEEMRQENELLKEAEKKRKKRGPKKNLERGDNFKTLKSIEEDSRLSEFTMYVVSKMIRVEFFMNMKYFNDFYKDSCLKRAFEGLRMTDQDNINKYKDYVVYYIEKKITQQRNNAVYALKKCMLGLDEGGKYENG